MSTPASIARHPIHPMLVGIPIGLWTFSVIADVIYALGWGGSNWKTVAFYCIGGGVIAALLAAVPGFIDFLSISDARVWRVGIFHMAANLTAVVLFAISVGLRWAGSVGFLPVAVSIVGLILLGVAGWLGGELVFVHNMGVTPPRAAPRHQSAPASPRRRASGG
jgi:uncharacterized membrane protein